MNNSPGFLPLSQGKCQLFTIFTLGSLSFIVVMGRENIAVPLHKQLHENNSYATAIFIKFEIFCCLSRTNVLNESVVVIHNLCINDLKKGKPIEDLRQYLYITTPTDVRPASGREHINGSTLN